MNDVIVLIVRFTPREGRYEEFRSGLFSLVDVMAAEPDFINAIVHDDLDTGELVIYEIWRGTKESWLANEPPKPYRREYEEIVPRLLVHRHISWLVPNKEAGSALTGL